MVTALLTSVVNVSNHTKYLSMNNQKCKIQPNLMNLLADDYSQELHYCLFAVKLDRFVGRCNILNDLY